MSRIKIQSAIYLILFSSLTLYSQGQNPTSMSFKVSENPQGLQSFTFLNESPNQLYTWTFGDGISITDSANVVVHEYLNPGTYIACLTTPNATGYSSVGYCQNIIVNPNTTVTVDSICQYDDCVFPGDANADQVVNMYDVLSVGLGYNFAGYARYNPTTNFVGQAVADWNFSTVNGADRKHADCNGDGTIDQSDIALIQQHYDFEHNGLRRKDKGIGAPLKVVIDTAIVDPLTNQVHVQAGIEIGDFSTVVNDLYGLALGLKYDPTFIDSASINITYQNSFLGHKDSLLRLDVNRYSQGVIDFALTRKDLQTANGIGRFATLTLTIEDDIMIQAPSNQKFGFDIAEYLALDNFGKQIKLTTQGDEIDLNPISGTISKNNNINVAVFPNPATEQFQLAFKNVQGEYIEIFNQLGQRVSVQKIIDNQPIDVSTFAKGTYWLNIHTNKGFITKGLIVK